MPPSGFLMEDILAIGRRCASLPDRDTRKPDEVLGYDTDVLKVDRSGGPKV